MWTSGNQRIKALFAAREREHARLGLPIHLSRADVQIRIPMQNGEERIVNGRAMLSDFKEKGLYLYVAERLPPNLEVVFEIKHPDHFELVGKVIWCQYQPTSNKIISEQPFPYRIGLGFHHASEVSTTVFAEFCARMAERYTSERMLFEGGPTIELNAQEETSDVTPVTLKAVPNVAEEPVEATATAENPSAADATPATASEETENKAA